MHNSSHLITCINNSSFKQIVVSLLSDNYLQLLSKEREMAPLTFLVSQSFKTDRKRNRRTLLTLLTMGGGGGRGEILLYLRSSSSAQLQNADSKSIFLLDDQRMRKSTLQ